jgi:hypothetical protein
MGTCRRYLTSLSDTHFVANNCQSHRTQESTKTKGRDRTGIQAILEPFLSRLGCSNTVSWRCSVVTRNSCRSPSGQGIPHVIARPTALRRAVLKYVPPALVLDIPHTSHPLCFRASSALHLPTSLRALRNSVYRPLREGRWAVRLRAIRASGRVSGMMGLFARERGESRCQYRLRESL